ncbi:MAG TPA: NAD-dependent epimerase/dehydratase family protein [candidate division Zixibacteria bacterium]|nr:NAD-dependent epimerase/dehydratase family protein [candidate division Zixibacteria bacterium]MDD4917989.1 NAD-dependent epimerase/dehydratase family protein [candidate division Zixibacteria bacterium]MDM7972459.1 NAD-dependent epimerase/dehydratase family protein [candidate division Zixibacteria bacterium]HOD66533.1 NAD-dependent epimerase/dehydratase family protein [candidate division Zixibacteria bacterium]HPC11324.1 NAD-dependent epimerase/dehydratase family protein [candidate division Z
MNILIIGGTRFMGPVVAAQLLADGHRVTVFHRGETEQDVPAGVHHIHGDRGRLADYRRQWERLRPDVVLDMMALTGPQAGELVAAMSGLAGRLVAASSCDVYRNFGLILRRETGRATSGRLTEDSPLRDHEYPYRQDAQGPADPFYDYDKIHVEREIQRGPLPACAIRLPMVYGPNDPKHRLYSYARRMSDRRPALLLDTVRADWRGIRGYRDNCAHALCLAVARGAGRHRVYNVGEAEALTEAAWIRAIGAALGWEGDIVTVADRDLPDYLRTPLDWRPQLDVDSSRIRNELGYGEIVDLQPGLARTLEWELAHPPDHPADRFDYAQEDAILRRSRPSPS